MPCPSSAILIVTSSLSDDADKITRIGGILSSCAAPFLGAASVSDSCAEVGAIGDDSAPVRPNKLSRSRPFALAALPCASTTARIEFLRISNITWWRNCSQPGGWGWGMGWWPVLVNRVTGNWSRRCRPHGCKHPPHDRMHARTCGT